MGTNRKELAKGLKYEIMALPILVLAPIVITIGFKAIKQQNNYLWLIIGILLAITAVTLGFIGVRTILKAFFDNN